MQQEAMATRRSHDEGSGNVTKAKQQQEEPYDEEATLQRALAGKEDLMPTGNGEAHSVVPWEARVPEEIREDERCMTIISELVAEAGASGIQVRILHDILDAETIEETAMGGLRSIQDVCKEDRNGETPPYFVRGFSVNLSDFEEGEALPVYLAIDVVNTTTGEAEMIATGSTQTVLTLYRWRQKEWFPVVVRWRRSAKETARGMRPINLEIVNPDPLGKRNLKAEIETTTHRSGWEAPAS
jgi:hypothetical protein